MATTYDIPVIKATNLAGVMAQQSTNTAAILAAKDAAHEANRQFVITSITFHKSISGKRTSAVKIAEANTDFVKGPIVKGKADDKGKPMRDGAKAHLDLAPYYVTAHQTVGFMAKAGEFFLLGGEWPTVAPKNFLTELRRDEMTADMTAQILREATSVADAYERILAAVKAAKDAKGKGKGEPKGEAEAEGAEGAAMGSAPAAPAEVPLTLIETVTAMRELMQEAARLAATAEWTDAVQAEWLALSADETKVLDVATAKWEAEHKATVSA